MDPAHRSTSNTINAVPTDLLGASAQYLTAFPSTHHISLPLLAAAAIVGALLSWFLLMGPGSSADVHVLPQPKRGHWNLPSISEHGDGSKELVVEQVPLRKLKKDELITRMRAYGLDPCSKKDDCLDSLIEYSKAGYEHWKHTLLPMAVRFHHVSQVAAESQAPTPSKTRKRYTNPLDRRLNEIPHNITARSQHIRRPNDQRSMRERSEMQEWINAVSNLINEDQQKKAARARAATESTPGFVGSQAEPHLATAMATISNPFACQRLLHSLVGHPTTGYSGQTRPASISTSTITIPSTPVVSIPSSVSISTSSTPQHSPALPSLAPSSPVDAPLAPQDQHTISIEFSPGDVMRFGANEVPRTQPLAYSTDVDALICDWDNGGPICVRGRRIPVKYYDLLYKKNRNMTSREDQWTNIKKRWTPWRDFMLKYKHLGGEEFWAQYTKDGKRLPFSSISKLMLEERKRYNEALAERAREEYAGSFSSKFCYRSGRSKTVEVMSDVVTIAKRYCELSGQLYQPMGIPDDD